LREETERRIENMVFGASAFGPLFGMDDAAPAAWAVRGVLRGGIHRAGALHSAVLSEIRPLMASACIGAKPLGKELFIPSVFPRYSNALLTFPA
jgi:hypothetical protein